MSAVRSRLFARLLTVVLLVLILPVAGLWSLGVFERELLVAQERSLATAARALAAGLAEAHDDGGWVGAGSVAAGEAASLLARIERPLAGRVRVYDAAGKALVDSAAAAGPHDGSGSQGKLRDTLLYRTGAALWRWRRALFGPPAASPDAEQGDGGQSAVAEALRDGYGATTRISADGSWTVITIAVPVRAGGAVRGVVVVSRSTELVLAALDRIRVELFRVVLFSVAAAALVVWVLARGLVRPLRRLRDAADAVLARSRGRGALFPGAARPDEIGDLARALGGLNERLERRLDELEAFTSDVAHEVKNPLAAMRSAAELLRRSTDESEIRQLTALIVDGVGRIDATVGALQELARLDAEQAPESPPEGLPLGALASRVLDGWRPRLPAGVTLELDAADGVAIAAGEEGVVRVLENLLANAISFVPADGTIRVGVATREGGGELVVEDSGPGVPEEHRGRVFERFFSWRPESPRGAHLGLGLGIARAIVERHGGEMELAEPSALGGARFLARWPLAGAGADSAGDRSPQRSGRYQ